eukprot:3461927-Pyramimonas_sp.AAC.1
MRSSAYQTLVSLSPDTPPMSSPRLPKGELPPGKCELQAGDEQHGADDVPLLDTFVDAEVLRALHAPRLMIVKHRK